MKRLFAGLLIAAALLSGCSSSKEKAIPTSLPESGTLIVFAAASLTDAFTEMADAFEEINPGVTVMNNFAGSQALRTQIEQGAQVDVFASANLEEMDALVSANFVPTSAVKTFATNRLIMIMPASNPAGLSELEDLAKPGIKVVLAAAEVPVGKYALQVLEKLDSAYRGGYKEEVLSNVVSYENDVKQVVTKVQLGEADAGIVYSSDAVAAAELSVIEIPTEDNVTAQFPVAFLTHSKNQDLAVRYINFVFSEGGQAILEKWGFLPGN